LRDGAVFVLAVFREAFRVALFVRGDILRPPGSIAIRSATSLLVKE